MPVGLALRFSVLRESPPHRSTIENSSRHHQHPFWLRKNATVSMCPVSSLILSEVIRDGKVKTSLPGIADELAHCQAIPVDVCPVSEDIRL